MVEPTTNEIEEFTYAEETWEEIDDLVSVYQKVFLVTYDMPKEEQRKIYLESQAAIEELVERFYPLFKKYLGLLKTGQINFNNREQRLFVASFMPTAELRYALYGKKAIDRETCSEIYQRFNFVRESYGHLDTDEIMTDLKMLFMTLAKRYKRTGKSFCCYITNVYRYELFRHIQKFTKNPLNIHYKNVVYEDCAHSKQPDLIDDTMEDHIYENQMGLPDMTWFSGENCSGPFSVLTPEERVIISKYYLENMCDRQIADLFGMHINTCNTKRRMALAKLAKAVGVDVSQIKRSRNSGKKALL